MRIEHIAMYVNDLEKTKEYKRIVVVETVIHYTDILKINVL